MLTLAATTNMSILTTIAAGFGAAWVLGIITQRIGLSPIVGYLLAGVVLGRHTPGFIADEGVALQLAEVGVILLMFGVGLHFHLRDLIAVRRVAIPGAIGQVFLAMLATALIFHFVGWPLKSTLVLGMAISVASTVVLLRVLMDRNMLSTSHGHVAVGWLIIEDIFTVIALVLVPMLAPGEDSGGGGGGMSALTAIGWGIAKLAALVAIVLLAGSRVVPWVLMQVAKLRSSELFTLTVLVLSITIAVAAYLIFGASVALGAFLAGMVVSQSPLSHQAAADALPMRDAFAVIFFVSIGMLFDPSFLIERPILVAAGLAVVMLVKPLAAIFIVAVLGYPARTALTVALGLAQIGEFSFILAQVASDHSLLPEGAMNLIVASAIISITLNPMLFGSIDRIEHWLRTKPTLWKLLNTRADQRARDVNAKAVELIDAQDKPFTLIVGYGPVGRVVDALIRDAGLPTVVLDMNIDTIRSLTEANRPALFGDATRREVLEQAGIRKATHMVVTLPHKEGRGALVLVARELNPTIDITVRARYLAERDELRDAGANRIVYEEGEAGIALARHVMLRRGVSQQTIDKLLDAIRKVWRMEN